MAKKLYLTFEDSRIKTSVNVAIAGPKTDLKKADVEAVANTLITLKAFNGIKGEFDTFKGAQYKETVVDKIA